MEEIRNANKIFIGKPQWSRPLGGPKKEVDLKEGYFDVKN
jgi:hypothetical protein